MKKTQKGWNSTLAPSGFKKKTKGSKRKAKPTAHKLAKDKAWDACSRYIRLRDSLRTTGTIERCACVTCGKVLPAFGKGCIQAGHWLGGRKGKNLFDERGIHGQCYGCNCCAGGQQIAYTAWMTDYYGHDVMDELVRQGNMPYKYSVDELYVIRAEYDAKAKKLA